MPTSKIRTLQLTLKMATFLKQKQWPCIKGSIISLLDVELYFIGMFNVVLNLKAVRNNYICIR